jgi:hypothetical protein
MSGIYLETAKDGRYVHRVADGMTRRIARIDQAIGGRQDFSQLKTVKGQSKKVNVDDEEVTIEGGTRLVSIEKKVKETLEKMTERLYDEEFQDRMKRDLANYNYLLSLQ